MIGTLYLIPNSLASLTEEASHQPLNLVIPDQILNLTATLDYYIAENAKTTRAFLNHVNQTHPLSQPIQSIVISELNIRTSHADLPKLLAPLLSGKNAGLISEAGVPAVADPGANLVRLAHEHRILVRPLVGPSSLLLALMGSGLNGQCFAFQGYLPTDNALRIKQIHTLEAYSHKANQTQIFIETPYRNHTLCDAFIAHCQPNTLLCIATDLTMTSEQIRTQTIAAWKADIAQGRGPNIQKNPTVFLLLAQ